MHLLDGQPMSAMSPTYGRFLESMEIRPMKNGRYLSEVASAAALLQAIPESVIRSLSVNSVYSSDFTYYYTSWDVENDRGGPFDGELMAFKLEPMSYFYHFLPLCALRSDKELSVYRRMGGTTRYMEAFQYRDFVHGDEELSRFASWRRGEKSWCAMIANILAHRLNERCIAEIDRFLLGVKSL